MIALGLHWYEGQRSTFPGRFPQLAIVAKIAQHVLQPGLFLYLSCPTFSPTIPSTGITLNKNVPYKTPVLQE